MTYKHEERINELKHQIPTNQEHKMYISIELDGYEHRLRTD